MERVIFAHYPPGFSSDNSIFPYASFVETSKVRDIQRSYVFFNENHSRTHSPLQYKEPSIYSYKHFKFGALSVNIKKLIKQFFSNKKGLAMIKCHFRLIQ
jgi:hypothetical protein